MLGREPPATRSCRRRSRGPRRTCWRSSRRSALELRPSVRVGLSRALGARVAPEAIVVVVSRSWACPQCISLSCVHLFEQFGGGGSRICACCELQPCGIRSRDQCGLGSRLGRASELACVHESVHPVVLLRCVDAYILSSRCTHSTQV